MTKRPRCRGSYKAKRLVMRDKKAKRLVVANLASERSEDGWMTALPLRLVAR